MGLSPIVNKSAITHSISAAIGLNLLDCVGAPAVGLAAGGGVGLLAGVGASVGGSGSRAFWALV